jgi:hypothetical protein
MKTAVILGLALTLAAGIAAEAPAPPDVSGEWELTTRFLGHELHSRLVLEVVGGKLAGTLHGDRSGKVEGTVDGGRVRFAWRDDDGSTDTYEGVLRDGTLSGTVTFSGEVWGGTPAST